MLHVCVTVDSPHTCTHTHTHAHTRTRTFITTHSHCLPIATCTTPRYTTDMNIRPNRLCTVYAQKLLVALNNSFSHTKMYVQSANSLLLLPPPFVRVRTFYCHLQKRVCCVRLATSQECRCKYLMSTISSEMLHVYIGFHTHPDHTQTKRRIKWCRDA